MKTEKQKELFEKAIKQLEIGLPIWTEHWKNRTIEYLDGNLKYHEEDKKIVKKSLKNVRKNQLTKNPIIKKITNFRLKELSGRISKLVWENKNGNLTLPKNIGLILRATDFMIKYVLGNQKKYLTESIELTSKVISENGISDKQSEQKNVG